MSDKRYNKRVPFRATVRYGLTEEKESMSFVTDLSATGICIKTNKVYKPGTKIFMTVEIDGIEFNAEGTIQWAKIVPAQLVRAVKNGMGIKFTRADEGLLDFYKNKLYK